MGALEMNVFEEWEKNTTNVTEVCRILKNGISITWTTILPLHFLSHSQTN